MVDDNLGMGLTKFEKTCFFSQLRGFSYKIGPIKRQNSPEYEVICELTRNLNQTPSKILFTKFTYEHPRRRGTAIKATT